MGKKTSSINQSKESYQNNNQNKRIRERGKKATKQKGMIAQEPFFSESDLVGFSWTLTYNKFYFSAFQHSIIYSPRARKRHKS